MTMQNTRQKRMIGFAQKDIWFIILFVLSYVLNIITTYHVTHTICDSDSASTLVYAYHQSQETALISNDWFYSTELSFLDTHLVYAPLFMFFQDWQTVRFIGTLILQAFLLLSFCALCRTMAFNRRASLLGCSLLILPFSTTYGRLVLYHTYYIPYLTISFLLISLVFRCNQDFRLHHSTSQKALHLAAIALLAFACGISGIRQLGISLLPLIAALSIILYQANWTQPNELKRLLVFVPSIGMLMLSTILGLICNGLLSSVYVFPNYGQSATSMSVFSQLTKVSSAFAHHFGFRNHAQSYLPYQLMNVIGILAGVWFTVLSFVTLIKRTHFPSLETETLQHLYPCGLLVAILPFFFLSSITNYVTYFLFYLIWLIPLVLLILYTERPYSHLLNSMQRIAAIAIVAVMFTNSLINSVYFIAYEHMPFQQYEGLGDWDIQTAKNLKPICTQLLDEGYDLGYCTYWRSNIMTDITDGKLKTITIEAANSQDGFVYCDWLTLKSNREPVPNKPFLAMDPNYRSVLEKSPLFTHCRLICETPQILIYALDDPSLMKKHLDSQGYTIRYDDVGT